MRSKVAIVGLAALGGVGVLAALWMDWGRDSNEGGEVATFPAAQPPVVTNVASPPTAAPKPTLKQREPAQARDEAILDAVSRDIASRDFKEPPQMRRDPFEGLPVIANEDSPVDRDGRFTRLKVLRTSMKYPLIRVEEKYHRDPMTGEETLKGRVAMAADHVTLRLESGYTSEDLQRAVARVGMRVLKPLSTPNLYLVAFDLGANNGAVHSLEKSIATLKAEKMISAPEPDYYVRAQ